MAAAGAELSSFDPQTLTDEEKTEYMQRMQMKMSEQMAQMVQQQQMAVQQQQATEAALANALAAKNAFFFSRKALADGHAEGGPCAVIAAGQPATQRGRRGQGRPA